MLPSVSNLQHRAYYPVSLTAHTLYCSQPINMATVTNESGAHMVWGRPFIGGTRMRFGSR
jgi:hypothetical protein